MGNVQRWVAMGIKQVGADSALELDRPNQARNIYIDHFIHLVTTTLTLVVMVNASSKRHDLVNPFPHDKHHCRYAIKSVPIHSKSTLNPISGAGLCRTYTPQQHDRVTADQGLVDLLAKPQQAAALDVVDAQPLLLGLDAVIDVGDLQPAGGVVQQAANAPVLGDEEVGAGQFARGAGGLGLDAQIQALLRGQLVVALGRLFQGVQRGQLRGPAGRFGLGSQRLLLHLAPALEPPEAQLELVLVALQGDVERPRAQRSQVLAVVVLTHAVLEAVAALAVRAVHARVLERVDEGLARRVGALRRVAVVGFGGCRRREPSHAVPPSVLRPLARMAAAVCRLGAVIEAEGVAARLAAEGQEIELVAVGKLAVRADVFDVFVHGCVGGIGHGVGRRHGGRFGEVYRPNTAVTGLPRVRHRNQLATGARLADESSADLCRCDCDCNEAGTFGMLRRHSPRRG